MLRNLKKPLRLAIVAPPFGETGGPEVVTQNLTNALLNLGVDVTLFAPKDWKTKAKHIPTLEKSLWNMKDFKKQDPTTRRNYIISSQVKVLSYQDDFDIIHLHSQKYAYIVAKNSKIPCLLTFHNKITPTTLKQLEETPLKKVAITNYQKGKLSLDAVINNGVPIENIPFSIKKGDYLITIGRLSEQKGIDTAIKLALKTNKKLLIFGRVGSSPDRQSYFQTKIKPFIDNKQIIYKKEVSNKEIFSYLQNASAPLFTIKRPEVFGMVAIESLACGTPVIGTGIDPLPETLNNKEVAFLSNNFDELVEKINNLDSFDRKKCREYAKENFDSQKMAKSYYNFYQRMLNE